MPRGGAVIKQQEGYPVFWERMVLRYLPLPPGAQPQCDRPKLRVRIRLGPSAAEPGERLTCRGSRQDQAEGLAARPESDPPQGLGGLVEVLMRFCARIWPSMASQCRSRSFLLEQKGARGVYDTCKYISL